MSRHICCMTHVCPISKSCDYARPHDCSGYSIRSCDRTVPENMRNNVMCVMESEAIKPEDYKP